MRWLAKTCLTAFVVLVALSSLPQDRSTAQTRQKMTPEQIRQGFTTRLEAELKRNGKLKNGWQIAYESNRGAVYTYVLNSRVKSVAISDNSIQSAKVLNFLNRNARDGGNRSIFDKVTGVAKQPINPNGGPSVGECIGIFLNCIFHSADLEKVGGCISGFDLGCLINLYLNSPGPDAETCATCKRVLQDAF